MRARRPAMQADDEPMIRRLEMIKNIVNTQLASYPFLDLRSRLPGDNPLPVFLVTTPNIASIPQALHHPGRQLVRPVHPGRGDFHQPLAVRRQYRTLDYGQRWFPGVAAPLPGLGVERDRYVELWTAGKVGRRGCRRLRVGHDRASHSARRGHDASDQLINSEYRQNVERPIRTGRGIQPAESQLRQVRNDLPHMAAAWRAVTRIGASPSCCIMNTAPR